MTIETLNYLESEVETIVAKTLDVVRDKSFSDYVLLLAYAGYQVENENTFLSPYVLQSQLEIYQDNTRNRFLVTYLNNFRVQLQDQIFADNDYREMDYNIQMMIYSQIWESHLFLKILRRIALIISGKPYEWRIQFEKINEKGKMKQVSKAKFIEDLILNPLRDAYPEFAYFIRDIYDSQLRNDFAHASYSISIDENVIESQDSEQYSSKRRLDLYDWEEKFFNTALFCYHLSHELYKRLNSFIEVYPEKTKILIKWPSFQHPCVILDKYIEPRDSGRGVEFSFCNQ
jgi:hypothetical protein